LDRDAGAVQRSIGRDLELDLGEFVGGSDIMREMYDSGELQQMLKDAGLVGED